MKKASLSKRTVILYLVALVLLNIAIRYPSTPHEMGADGFANNVLANSITEHGYARWQLSMASLFGLGPFSYPMTIHYLLSMVSQLSGLNMEETVLFLTFIIAALGTILSFAFARCLFDDNRLALLSSFLLSISPIFLRLTTWNGSSRSLVMVYLLLILCIIMKTGFIKRAEQHSGYYEYRFTILGVLLMVLLGTMHRMSIFLILVLFSILMAMPILRLKFQALRMSGPWSMKKHKMYSIGFLALWLLLIVAIIFTQLVNFGIYKGMNLWYKYQFGLFFSGSSIAVIFVNMVIDYWSGWGILSAFAVPGIYYLFMKRNKKFKHMFIIFAILFLAPVATLGLYAELVSILFFLPVISMGIINFINSKRIRKAGTVALAFLLISSFAFSMALVEHWRNSAGGDYMKETQYDIGLYMRTHMDYNDTFVTNNNVFGNRVLSISSTRFLTQDFPYPVIYDWVTKGDIEKLVDWNRMIEEKSIEVNYPEEYQVTIDHRTILQNEVDHTRFIRNIYGVNYVIENRVTTSNYFMGSSLEATRYVIFDNTEGRIWYIGH